MDDTQKEAYKEYVLSEDMFEETIELAKGFPKSKYDDYTLYKYGLDVAVKANELNYILRKARKSTKKIKHQFEKLRIHDQDELDIKKQELMQMLKEFPAEVYIECLGAMEKAIILGELENEYDLLYQFVANFIRSKKEVKSEEETVEETVQNIEPREEREFDFDQRQIDSLIRATTENELAENLMEQGQLVKNYTELKINQLEKRLREQEKMIQLKDEQLYELEKRTLKEKLSNDVDKLVQRNLESLKELNYIDTSYNEKLMLSRELQKIYRQFLSNVESKYQDIMNEEKKDEEV